LEQRLVDGRQRAAEQNSVTVRACAGYRGGTQRAAAAADVLDNYGAEQRFHLFHPWACESIEGAAWRKRNHQPNRPRWIGFRAGSAHAGREHGGTRDEVQEFAPKKFHGALPESFCGTAYQRVAPGTRAPRIIRLFGFDVCRLDDRGPTRDLASDQGGERLRAAR